MLIQFLSNYRLDEFIVFTVALFCLLVAAIKFFDYLNERFHIVETRKTKTQEKNINTLLESDMVRIKGEIIKEHNQHMRLGYIDYKTLDYLQRQFRCYEKEGGNSYVHNLMDDMEKLPLNE